MAELVRLQAREDEARARIDEVGRQGRAAAATLQRA
jgi:hypothetical protein